jgi:hypothetical protein
MMNDPHSSRGLVDSRALSGKLNCSFRYLLHYHDSFSAHAVNLLVGCFFLRKDIESGSSCSQNSCRRIRPPHNRSFCALSGSRFGFIGRSRSSHSFQVICDWYNFIHPSRRSLIIGHYRNY